MALRFEAPHCPLERAAKTASTAVVRAIQSSQRGLAGAAAGSGLLMDLSFSCGDSLHSRPERNHIPATHFHSPNVEFRSGSPPQGRAADRDGVVVRARPAARHRPLRAPPRALVVL